MHNNRKQLTQISISIVIVLLIIALIAFGGSWIVDTFKEMHGL